MAEDDDKVIERLAAECAADPEKMAALQRRRRSLSEERTKLAALEFELRQQERKRKEEA
jgi:hypothetical protein